MRSFRFSGALVGLLLATPALRPAVADPPHALRDFLATSGLSDSALGDLADGHVVAGLLSPAVSHEIAVCGAVRVPAPAPRIVERIADATRVKTGTAIVAIGKFSSTPVIDDVKAVRLLPPDVDALARCARGRCDSKLAALAPEEFRRFDWSAPHAQARAEIVVRAGLVRYVSDYMARGDQALMDYRDVRHPVSLAREFHELVEASPYLHEHAPELRRHLLESPRLPEKGVESYLYWATETFGLKPVLSVYHVASAMRADYTIVASKQIFASRYFDTSLEMMAVARDPDSPVNEASYLWYIARSRVDSLRGWLGRFKRGAIEKEARAAAVKMLTAARRACTPAP